MNTSSHYDVAIIGAGMSGLAAGIRLAHFGKKVCIFERHNALGGLNSFYSIDGRKYDVGLHAMTNYVAPGTKGKPLGKLLRQLRIDREEFALCPQKQSRIAFGPRGETSLRFTNDFAVLDAEVTAHFPQQADRWRRLVQLVRTYDDVSLDAKPQSARAVVGQFLTDPLLTDMIFCPVMYYGSAQERDMEFGQFVIMFKALFLEGFARPVDGVRVILRVLLEKYRAAGGERRMKCGVKQIIEEAGRASRLILDDDTEVTATHVISSIGYPETLKLCGPAHTAAADANTGALSFIETISIFKRQPAEWGWGDDTIIFFNDSARFEYAQAREQRDLHPKQFQFRRRPAARGYFPRHLSRQLRPLGAAAGGAVPSRQAALVCRSGAECPSVPAARRRRRAHRRTGGDRHVHAADHPEVHRPFQWRHLRRPTQDPEWPHAFGQPVSVRHGSGFPGYRRRHVERHLDGEFPRAAGEGLGHLGPGPATADHAPQFLVALWKWGNLGGRLHGLRLAQRHRRPLRHRGDWQRLGRAHRRQCPRQVRP
jgi:glycine/D-amino acid oxidase-like deaminating enzyme